MTITSLNPVGRALRSARLRAALSLGVVATVGATGTFAYWTDSVTIAGATFTAASIDLQVNGSNTVTGYTALNMAPMLPGDSTAAVLTISNNGTAPLKYTAATTATNTDGKNLAAALTIKVTADTATAGSGRALTCPGVSLAGASTTLNGSLISTGRQLTAPPATTSAQKICVQVTLPSTVTDTNLQSGATNVGFTFTGTSDLS